jgi:hypothetical protein
MTSSEEKNSPWNDLNLKANTTPPLLEELFKRKSWEDFFYKTPCVKSSKNNLTLI